MNMPYRKNRWMGAMGKLLFVLGTVASLTDVTGY